MIRILAVEDEPAIQRLLGAVLARGGYDVVAAATAREALGLLARGGIDAVLLDLGLPDRDGLELIGAIRSTGTFPILVLTARTDIAEKVSALDLGADDYVTKPFDGDELLARLRSSLRRSRPNLGTDNIIEHGAVRIDVAHHTAFVNGRQVALTPREFSVLEALTDAGGRVLTHTALLKRVWGAAHLDDVEYLRVVIRALRLKIEDDPSEPKIIRNEPGIGYRLV